MAMIDEISLKKRIWSLEKDISFRASHGESLAYLPGCMELTSELIFEWNPKPRKIIEVNKLFVIQWFELGQCPFYCNLYNPLR